MRAWQNHSDRKIAPSDNLLVPIEVVEVHYLQKCVLASLGWSIKGIRIEDKQWRNERLSKLKQW